MGEPVAAGPEVLGAVVFAVEVVFTIVLTTVDMVEIAVVSALVEDFVVVSALVEGFAVVFALAGDFVVVEMEALVDMDSAALVMYSLTPKDFVGLAVIVLLPPSLPIETQPGSAYSQRDPQHAHA